MAFNFHALNLLRYAHKLRPLGTVATIGRQGLSLSAEYLRSVPNLSSEKTYGPFCEELLVDCFGVELVNSFDYSDYEGATHIVDMSKPINLQRKYDTVIDAGSLEHIFDVRQALENVSKLCAVGGQILHLLPANNYCGHGFWQFSPELFYSLYSESNGYKRTQAFLAISTEEKFWYEVKRPVHGERAEFVSEVPLYIVVRTEKYASPVSYQSIQQSDYVYSWKRGLSNDQARIVSTRKATRTLDILKGIPTVYRFGRALNRFILKQTNSKRLSGKHPNVIRHTVANLLK
jgi:hypothetical protein